MRFNRLSSTTVIMVTVAVMGLMLSSGHELTSAYGFQQPYIYGPTPYNPPTTSQPSPSSLDNYGDACDMTATSAPYTTTSGPSPSYMYANSTSNTTASSWTGWCVNENVTASGNPENGNELNSLDIKHPCWVNNGIGYYGDCDVAPVVGYTQNPTSSNGGIPTEEWFHLAGVFLKPGQFLDLADTTPWYTTHGHMAMVLPCETDGTPDVRLYQGIIDGGVFTMEASNMQYLQHISNPAGGICVYHFDIGNTTDADYPYNPPGSSVSLTESANPFGVTDFALINTSTHNVYFSANFERYTSTFSIANGFMNVIG